MASKVSERRARQLEAERMRIERMAVRSMGPFGFRLRTAAIDAYRNGRPVNLLIRNEIRNARELVANSMTLSHLYGRARTEQLPRARGASLSISGDALSGGLSLINVRNTLMAAIEFVRKRLDLSSTAVRQVQDLYTIEAATATGQVGSMLEDKVLSAIARASEQGMHVRDGINEVRKAFDAAGVTPTNSYTIENLFRTQTAMAYSAGRLNANEAPEIQEILWGYEYTSVGDDRVRPEHAAMDGVRRPKDDPIWQRWMPPCGYSCRCSVIEIFVDDPELAKPTKVPTTTRDANGDQVPVLPDDGWDFNPGQVFKDVLAIASSS